MRRLRCSMTLVALLALGACNGSDKVAGSDPTVPTSVTTSAATSVTTAAADPFATPAMIDAPYLDRVLVELNRVYSETTRSVVSRGRYDRGDLDPLRAIFNQPLLEVQVDLFGKLPTIDPTIFRQPVGDRRMTVQELVTVEPDCIFARVAVDVSAVVMAPPPTQDAYITLSPTPGDADPAGHNPTHWSMANESNARQDPCAG